MNKGDRKLIDLLISLIFFVITSIGLLLRSLQFDSNLLRFIVNSLGNIGGVIVCSFLFIWWVKESSLKKRELVIFSVGVGLIIYEFLQIVIPWQTFDVKDIIGTLIGVIIASIMNLLIVVLRSIKLSS
ncbi:MAG: hypothetical protein EPN88_05915 [Bacteroidetes bacterium]|nr:MAG: hypothetical protein EPN88_05915 [Bacteroidota bacterium]